MRTIEVKDIVNQALEYIDTHLEERITVESVAASCGYSEYHFSRLFKSHLHVSIMEYVTKRRMIKASEEIIDGAKIIDVALKYGWQSHSGFTKAFKKEFGIYPALLRAMLAEMDNLGGNAMSHVFLNATEENATKEQLYDILKNSMSENGIDYDINEADQIYAYACKAYDGIKRYSGAEYVTHPFNVAIILAQLNADCTVIYAGMFCDVVKKGNGSIESFEQALPCEVRKLIRKASQQDGTSGVVFDDNVIMLKLAERLHNMRTISYIDKGKQSRRARETIDQFLPLARLLGNEMLIDELNDLSLKYIEK